MNNADPENNIFLVEKLLDRRWRKNRVEFLVKWLGYGESENTWEPKQNINPKLIDQYDTEHGGPLTGPPPKTPKTPKVTKRSAASTSATSTPSSTPSQRGRGRAPPKAREEIPVTPSKTRGRRRLTGGAESETNTSTASVDEVGTSSSTQEPKETQETQETKETQERQESEEPSPKKPRIAEEVESKPVEMKSPQLRVIPDYPSTPVKEQTTVTEVHIESVVEMIQEEPAAVEFPENYNNDNEPTNEEEDEVQFVEEVKVPTVDLTEDTPSPNEGKQPELVYEYEQAEFETIDLEPGSSTTIEKTQIIIETPVDILPDTTTTQREETTTEFNETVTYVIDDDDEPEVSHQIQETSTTTTIVTDNNGAADFSEQSTKSVAADQNSENQQEEYNNESVRNL